MVSTGSNHAWGILPSAADEHPKVSRGYALTLPLATHVGHILLLIWKPNIHLLVHLRDLMVSHRVALVVLTQDGLWSFIRAKSLERKKKSKFSSHMSSFSPTWHLMKQKQQANGPEQETCLKHRRTGQSTAAEEIVLDWLSTSSDIVWYGFDRDREMTKSNQPQGNQKRKRVKQLSRGDKRRGSAD